VNCEFDQEKLEECLARSINSCGLEDVLAVAGIQAGETVTLQINHDDATLVEHKLLIENHNVDVAQTKTDFEQEMKSFLKRAEKSHGLLSALPKSDPCDDGRTETPFTFTFIICRKIPIPAFIICPRPPAPCDL
jgi:hypothetical protein